MRDTPSFRRDRQRATEAAVGHPLSGAVVRQQLRVTGLGDCRGLCDSSVGADACVCDSPAMNLQLSRDGGIALPDIVAKFNLQICTNYCARYCEQGVLEFLVWPV